MVWTKFEPRVLEADGLLPKRTVSTAELLSPQNVCLLFAQIQIIVGRHRPHSSTEWFQALFARYDDVIV